MNVLSLFSGVGGFDMGLENAGMKTVFQCEIDKHCQSVLDRHWPDIPQWGDITTLTGEYILSLAPVIDVVAWGSPCQDLSVAGKRAGLKGSKSELFHEGIRIIRELRKATNNVYPRISIWENVQGALNSNAGADFGVILDQMAETGALVQEWRVLDAQYFGVPQRRRRVFLVSVFDSATAARCSDPLLPLCEGVLWNSAASPTSRQEPAGTVTESLASGGRNPILIDRAAFNQGVNAQYNTVISDHPVIPSLVARGPHAVATHTFVEPFVKARRAQTTSDHETWKPSQVSPTINQFDVGDTRATTAIVMDGTIGFDSTMCMGNANDDVSPPVKVGSGIGIMSPPAVLPESSMTVRRLTPLECERLMGWPDNHTLHRADDTTQADTQRYIQCGNGVASPVAEWVGQQLMKVG